MSQGQAKAVLRQYQHLIDVFFTCLLSPDYPKQLYVYEHRMHVAKMQCMRTLLSLTSATSAIVTLKLNTLYDVLLDCTQLRWRVTDHATFDVCKQELLAIHEELNTLLTLAIHPQRLQDENSNRLLERQIQKLEELYHSVLQVVTPNPLVFRLFIFSLQNLRQQLWDIQGLLK